MKESWRRGQAKSYIQALRQHLPIAARVYEMIDNQPWRDASLDIPDIVHIMNTKA